MANKLDNLRPMKPGQTLNPNGRPKGSRSISTVLKEMLEVMAPEKVRDAKFVKEFLSERKNNVSNAEVVAARLYYNAIVKGDNKAINDILDRTEGKVVTVSKVEQDNDISVVWEGDLSEADRNSLQPNRQSANHPQ